MTSRRSFPPLYVCAECGKMVVKDSTQTLRLASVWIRGSGKKVHAEEQEEHKFLHEWCLRDWQKRTLRWKGATGVTQWGEPLF